MSSFEAQIEKSRKEVAEAQAKMEALTSQIEVARTKLEAGKDISIDIENASLDEVHAHSSVMNENMAELILALDKVTEGFSRDFKGMQNYTGWEKFVGVFSKARMKNMRQERVRTSSVDDKLQDLLMKSDTIITLLQGQLGQLETQKARVESTLSGTLVDRESAVQELEQIKADLLAMDPDIIELENKISMEQNAAARTKLESQLAAKNAAHNELAQQEQVKLAESQSLERYIEMGKAWIDSLQNQAATQMVLINKLQIDTQHRVVNYDALSKSLKTAEQQTVAHQINEIGVKTDEEALAAMASIGAATNSRMADMLEQHPDQMEYIKIVEQEKAKADERFARRFAKIIERHETSNYGG